MKVIYDAEIDVLRIMLSDAPIEESSDQSGVILDYDEAGNVVGIEVLSACATDPRLLEPPSSEPF
jgi:uncharacterized protein YuzE